MSNYNSDIARKFTFTSPYEYTGRLQFTKDIFLSVKQIKRAKTEAKPQFPSWHILQKTFANSTTFVMVVYVWLLVDRHALYVRRKMQQEVAKI